MKKGDFIGRDALVEARKSGLTRKLSCMTLDLPDAVVMGKEPILVDDRIVGYVSSADYGYSIDTGIAYGYLPIEHAKPGAAVEIEYFGERYPATVSEEPLWDPKSERLKR